MLDFKRLFDITRHQLDSTRKMYQILNKSSVSWMPKCVISV